MYDDAKPEAQTLLLGSEGSNERIFVVFQTHTLCDVGGNGCGSFMVWKSGRKAKFLVF